MKKLYRGDAPACLGKYVYGRNAWGEVVAADKDEIWEKLIDMQGERCAYCECDLELGNRHIEHFVQRRKVPQETFDWSNIFGSCCIGNTCGLRKDRVEAYDHSKVIKPDIDDPDSLLLFVSDGTIKPLRSLLGAELEKAQTTLRVFGLHHESGQLRNMRRQSIAGYIQTAETIAEYAELDPSNELGWREELAEELEKVKKLPFSTAIRHMFESFIDC